MLTPTFVNLRYWFYAIGNTPAVNLLRDTTLPDAKAKEECAVKILLLACGDPRNLLFSLWCENGRSQSRYGIRSFVLMKLSRWQTSS